MRKTVRFTWMSLWLLATGAVALTSLSPSFATDLPPADAPIEQVIDLFVNERFQPLGQRDIHRAHETGS